MPEPHRCSGLRHRLLCSHAPRRLQANINMLTTKIAELVRQSEKLGEEGDVDGSVAAAAQAETLKVNFESIHSVIAARACVHKVQIFQYISNIYLSDCTSCLRGPNAWDPHRAVFSSSQCDRALCLLLCRARKHIWRRRLLTALPSARGRSSMCARWAGFSKCLVHSNGPWQFCSVWQCVWGRSQCIIDRLAQRHLAWDCRINSVTVPWPQISAVIVNNEETRVRDHLSGKNYKYARRGVSHQLNHEKLDGTLSSSWLIVSSAPDVSHDFRLHSRAWLKTHEKYREIKEVIRKRETGGFPRLSRSTERDRDRRHREPDRDRWGFASS